MQLVSRKTGKLVDVADSQVQAAYQSGDYGIPKGSRIPMVGDDGIGYVDASDAAAAFDQGQRIASPDEIATAKNEARYGGIGGAAAAAGLGAARGLTVGLSDPAIVGAARLFGGDESAEKARKGLQGYQSANPIASGAGEVAGAIAPLVLSGGSAAPLEAAEGARAAGTIARAGEAAADLGTTAVRAAGAPSRAVSAIGQAADRAVTSIAGEGLGGRVAGKVAAAGAEGGLYNLGSEASNATIQDDDLTGEKVLAALGHGALLGAAGGALLQGTGELSSYVMGRAAPHLTGVAEDQAWRSISARKGFTTEAERIPGGTKAIGRVLLDDGIISAGDTVESLAPKIADAKDTAGKQIGALLDAADQHGFEGPKIADIQARVYRDVVPELQKLGETNAGALRKVDTVLTDLTNYARTANGLTAEADASGLRLTYRQAQDFRARLDDLVKWNSSPLAPVNETTNALRGVRNAIETALTDAGESAAKKLGGSWATEYAAAKLKYRRLIVADKAATDTITRTESNASHSLTDKLFGSSGLNAGLTHGLAGGHGLHGLAAGGLHGLALGMVTGQVSKLVRTRGNATAAVLADKAAAIGGIQRAARAVDREIDRGVFGFFAHGSRAEPRVKATIKGGYAERVAQVQRAIGQAQDHVTTVGNAAGTFAAHAPIAANAFERAALRATAFLASKIPQGHRDTLSLTPQLEKPKVSDVEKAKFLRYADAVHDPAAVIADLRKGTITREQVEAVRTVYPELYSQIVRQVHDRLGEVKTPLPYSKQVQLGILLGIATHSSLKPDFVAAMQSGGRKSGGGGGIARAPTSPKRPLQEAANAAKLSGLNSGAD